MGKFLFILIALFFVYQMWSQIGVKKLFWFFGGILFFPQTIILFEKPYMPFPRFVIFSLLFILILQNKKWWYEYKKFPLFKALNFVILMSLAIGLFDPRLDSFLKIYRPAYYLIENFLVIYITYFYVRKINDVNLIYNCIIFFFLIFALYGLINYVSAISIYNSIIAEIYNSVDFANRYSEIGDARFRISSFSWHPIFYGLLLGIMIILITFLTVAKSVKRNKHWYITVLTLIIVNLLWTNSRTPLLALIAGLGIFLVFGLKFQAKVKLLFLAFVAIVMVLLIFPSSTKIVDESFNTFTAKGSKLEGSSVAMRDLQLVASLGLFYQKPYFGHGYSYIFEDLGYSTNKDNRTSDTDFAGFESYAYKLLIEQGMAGILSNLVFFSALTMVLMKQRYNVNEFGKKLIYASFGITITFLLFIFGTGDLGGFTFFMAIIGLNLKAIKLSVKLEESNN